MSRLNPLLIALAASLLAGCVSSILARKVVAPPNQSGMKALFADSPIITHAPLAFAETWKVAVGRPPAEIAVASIEPGDYGFVYDLGLEYAPGKDPVIQRFNAFWRSAGERSPIATPKGTLVFLHGYLQDKRFVTPWALRLAQEGYRCVVVDLRGHGDSTGKHISFGAFEAADVSAVIDDLARRGWDVSRVGLFGMSYGASVALLSAGRDPRVRAVVAFEPFASAERAVPELMRAVFAAQARGISDRQFADAHLKQARIAGFEWADADIPAALKRSTAPVLFLHGEADIWLSPQHSRDLLPHAPAGSRLELVPRDNHVTLPLQIRAFERAVIDWFGAMSSG
jgi:pimeloyl-ACP methyl ester carboxylesterase